MHVNSVLTAKLRHQMGCIIWGQNLVVVGDTFLDTSVTEWALNAI